MRNWNSSNKCSDWYKILINGRMKALLQKNFLRMYRNVGVLLFVFALPVMQVVLFCLAIGKDPTDLKMAIVNHEIPIGNSSCPVLYGCNLSLLSCRYLSFLNSDLIEKHYYSDLDTAINAVREGNVWGTLYLPRISRTLLLQEWP